MHNAAVKNDNQYVLDSTFVEMSSNRRICQWCKEELSHSAYFRHREDDKGVLCPGKQRLSCKLQLANETVTEEAEEGLSETSLDFLSSIGSANSESSFQFSESSVECEKQLLNKFLNLQVIYNMDNSVIQSKFVGMVFSDISSMKASENVTGSLTEGLHDAFLQSNSIYKASEPCIEKCFTDSEMEHMSLVYRKLYPHANINVISRFYYEFKTLFINGEEYISLKSRSTRSAAIIAHCS